jgi:hypothetical protein
MKKGAVLSLFILLIAASSVAFVYSFSNKSCTMPQTKKGVHPGFAVVELFTSEGCSSCPPADAAVARLLSKNRSNVFVLSFHVDYWNRLGWTDPFSQAAFSTRQRQYAQFFSLDGVYTPQVVVNGTSELVGSDEAKLSKVIETDLNGEPISSLSIQTERNGNMVTVMYGTAQRGVRLNVALVQSKATTVVKRGENSGRRLHHVNIVRALQTIDAAEKGYLTIEIPKALTDVPLQVIAYTQSKETFKILSARQQNL